MTYPPQQPGPYGQQGPWGQPQGQPPYQQPPSQTPPWLANGPEGFPSFDQEPKKSRTGLIVTLVVVGLLVLGGGGFGVWMLMSNEDDSGGGGGDGGGDARTAAEAYVRELEKTVNTDLADIDLGPMEAVTCADDFERMEREIGDAKDAGQTGPSGTIEVGMEDFQSTENEGSFTLTQTVDGEPGADTDMTLAKEDGAWKVCGLYGSTPPPSEGSEDTEASEGASPDEDTSGIPNPIPTG
ncbi:Rv0361 family membrane protein [Actinophytocola gossypii]|uniref:DUF4878 domain-containing protein n=1 Tax=Actinophytocola gossypii TaxID=2812003 RepID=A0ABT2J7Y3_9PSEU|nr:hypothetical protein [Actinophytocola gossypii]MCT2583600.1 hypothetical protein [Actinophytocola gossypii]